MGSRATSGPGQARELVWRSRQPGWLAANPWYPSGMRIPAWIIGVVLAAGCGPADKPAQEPEQAGTSKTCAAICKDRSPLTADYVKCLEGCPGPETIGTRDDDDTVD